MLSYCKKIVKKVLRKLLGPKRVQSVYFFTFHKCASSLFSTYILKNITGLKHVDYDMDMYSGKTFSLPLPFKKYNFAYGPLRLSLTPSTKEYEYFIKPIANPFFIKDKIAIFLVRDPRDILISAYYSFKFTHGFSSVPEIKARQLQYQATFKNKSLAEYVLDDATIQNKNFKTLHELASQCNRSVILKYEDMIENFDYFIAQLSKHIPLTDAVKQEIFKRSRPKKQEDITSHRRSGGVAGYKDKLDSETLLKLNEILKPTLQQFSYEF